MAVTVRKTGAYGREFSFSTPLAPEAVYDYLADFEKHSEWVPEIVAMEKTSEGLAGVGTTFTTTESMKPGSKMQDKTYCEITALERPRLIEWRARTEATGGPMAMRSRWAFVIEPEGDGSRVTQRGALEPPNLWSRLFLGVFVPLADGLFGGMGATPKNVVKHVERLQQVLDSKAKGG
jgi:uncharacterized protein YndB with AHSA1/START domain